MSFLRHREIYPSDGGAILAATPPLIVWMSFRLAIPWRVASPRIARLRFTNRFRVCCAIVLPVDCFSANGEQCLNYLCQPRGQVQIQLYA